MRARWGRCPTLLVERRASSFFLRPAILGAKWSMHLEIVDNAVVLAVPGAMDAGLDSPLFWGALAVALAVAWVVAFPVNRWLIARGRDHAVVHDRHH